jgi:hypothetical protein
VSAVDPVDAYLNGDDPQGFDANSRSLCPDELCVGLVGEDGRCKVCGKAGTPPASSPSAAPYDAPDPDAATGAGSPGASSDASADASGDSDPAFQDRALCPDGSCIGLLGPDGRCKECGKAA